MRALLPFTKYHGLGNDFILIDARELVFDPALSPLLANWSSVVKELAPRLCDRHHGVGADGVILAMPIYGASDTEPFESQARTGRGRKLSGEYPFRHTADNQPSAAFLASAYRQAVSALTSAYPQVDACQLSWVYTNSDGSNAVMCGNGLRCLALWARLRGGVRDNGFKISTAKAAVDVAIGHDRTISVDVGEPILDPVAIPVRINRSQKGGLATDELTVQARAIKFAAVSMGNPHCVIFDQAVWSHWSQALRQERQLLPPDQLKAEAKEELASTARQIQNDSVFPEGVNVEFVKVVDRSQVYAYVYERGCGFTLACASGAAAIVVAGVLLNLLDRNCTVRLPGGSLEITFSESDSRVRIKGEAEEVFSGVFKLELALPLELGSENKAEANCK